MHVAGSNIVRGSLEPAGCGVGAGSVGIWKWRGQLPDGEHKLWHKLWHRWTDDRPVQLLRVSEEKTRLQLGSRHPLAELGHIIPQRGGTAAQTRCTDATRGLQISEPTFSDNGSPRPST